MMLDPVSSMNSQDAVRQSKARRQLHTITESYNATTKEQDSFVLTLDELRIMADEDKQPTAEFDHRFTQTAFKLFKSHNVFKSQSDQYTAEFGVDAASLVPSLKSASIAPSGHSADQPHRDRPRSPSRTSLFTDAEQALSKGKVDKNTAYVYLSGFMKESRRLAQDPKALDALVSKFCDARQAHATFLRDHADSLARIDEVLAHLNSTPASPADELQHLRVTVEKVRQSIAMYLTTLDNALEARTAVAMRQRFQAHTSLLNLCGHTFGSTHVAAFHTWYSNEIQGAAAPPPLVPPARVGTEVANAYRSRNTK